MWLQLNVLVVMWVLYFMHNFNQEKSILINTDTGICHGMTSNEITNALSSVLFEKIIKKKKAIQR